MPDSVPAGVADRGKFQDPDLTADGSRRAQVALRKLETLWINTGTLCNLACRNCYIESSPRNDRLAYIRADEAAAYLDEIARTDAGTRVVGFTGGEPFMNPHFMTMLADALERGFETLTLTNAMRPMMKHSAALLELRARHGGRIRLRVSLDHYTEALHETERGERSWEPALAGLSWLDENGFAPEVAGRTCWGEDEASARAGYARLFARTGLGCDADDPVSLTLFPEMDEGAPVPEISAACWTVLGKSPSDIMCSSSRMVVKRRGAARPVVVACTLLPYDPRFELGETLSEAAGSVPLNHVHCARFCVLGGGACGGA
ncbi:MAG: radical SAM protein [Alphaproteobacteria bacterium]|nr:radical SAM protein [Alphaproteobacteria bacterium]